MVHGSVLLRHFDALQPGRKPLGDVLVHEALLPDTLRKALHRDRPSADVRQHARCNRLVIGSDLPFSNPIFREEHLLRVGNHHGLYSDAAGDTGSSFATSRGALSMRTPSKRGWRSLPWTVHSMNATCTTTSGRTQ